MHYIVFDPEWNQPANLRSSIQETVYLNREISAVKLNSNFSPADELRIYVTPQHDTRMYQDVEPLTGIRAS